MENDYKVLYVKTSVSSNVSKMAIFIKVIAILLLIVSAVLLLILGVSFDEEFILPTIITFASGISLWITQLVLKALSKITEAAEYHKAQIVQNYNQIKEDEDNIYKL